MSKSLNSKDIKKKVKNILVVLVLFAIVTLFYSVFLTNTSYPFYDRHRILSDVAFFKKSNEIYPLWNPYKNGGFPVLSSPEHFYVISQFVDTNSSAYNLQLNIILLSLILCIAYASYIFFRKVAGSTTLLSICGAITITCNQIFLIQAQTGRVALLETFLFTLCALIFTEKYLNHKKIVYFTLVALCCGLSFSFAGHYFLIFPMIFILMFSIWHYLTTENQGKLKSILSGVKYSISVLIIGIIACGFYTFPLIYYQMKAFSPIVAHTGTRLNCPSIDTLPGITLPLFFHGKTVLKQKAWPFVSYLVLPALIAFVLSYKSYRVQRQTWIVFLFIITVVPFIIFGIPHIGPLLTDIYLKIPLLLLIKHSIVASQIIVFSVALISVVCFHDLIQDKMYWWRYCLTGFVIFCVASSYVTLFPLANNSIHAESEIKRDIHVNDLALRSIFQADRNNFSDSQDHKMRIFNSDGYYRSVLSLSNQYVVNGFNLYFPRSYAISLALLSGRIPEASRPYQVKCNSCNPLRLKALDLLSITHLLCDKNTVYFSRNFINKWYKIFENKETNLYARYNQIENVKTFRKWEPVKNNKNMLASANASLNAFSNGIVLLNNIGSHGSFGNPSKEDQVTFKRISEGHIHISTNLETPAYLMIPENFSKEWTVYVGGEKKKLLNAYDAYMAVKLDSGVSVIEIKYQPLIVYISLAISLLTLLMLTAFSLLKSNRDIRC